MDALEKHEADVADLDERLSIGAPVCALCGHRITRMNFVSIVGPFTPVTVHSECADAKGGVHALMTSGYISVVARTTGVGEAPPTVNISVHGGFV